MPEQSAADISKALAPALGFAGAVIMLLFKREMETRRMLLATLSGPICAGLFTPSLVAWLAHQYAWLPNDDHLVAAVAFVVGLSSMNIVAIVAHIGLRAEAMVPRALDKSGDQDAR